MFTLGRCQLGRSPEPQGLWPNAGEEAAVRDPAILEDRSASPEVTERVLTLRDLGLCLHLGVLLICCESAMTWLLVLPTPILTPASGVPGSGPPSHLCVQMCVCVCTSQRSIFIPQELSTFLNYRATLFFVFGYIYLILCAYMCEYHMQAWALMSQKTGWLPWN